MRHRHSKRPVLPLLIVWLLMLPVPAHPRQTSQPQWQRVPELCKQLREEGWVPDPDLAGDSTTGVVEAARGPFRYCALKRDLPARGKNQPSCVAVLMQDRGGRSLNVIAKVWNETDRPATLDDAVQAFVRLARDLNLPPLPSGLPEAVRQAKGWEDEDSTLRYRVEPWTWANEKQVRPDLKPGEEPLLKVEIIAEPREPVR